MLTGLREILDRAAARHRVPGAAAAVEHHGELSEAATGVLNLDTGVEATPDSLFQIGSVSKTWTALLVMQLVDEGLIELDEPVAGGVTVRHLLTHTGGFHGDLFDDTGRGDDALPRYAALVRENWTQVTEPGALYSYNNAGFCLAGDLVARRTGGTWEDAVRDRIEVKAALFPEEALLSRVSVGHLQGRVSAQWQMPRAIGPAGAVICTTPRELIRFGRLVPESMIAPQVPIPGVPGRKATRYGLGVSLYDWSGTRAHGHDGDVIGQATVWRVLPDHDLHLAISANGGAFTAFFDEVVDAIVDELTGITPPPRPTPPAVRADVDLTPYTGRYKYPLYRYDVLAVDGFLDLTATPKSMAATIDGVVETIRSVTSTRTRSSPPHRARAATRRSRSATAALGCTTAGPCRGWVSVESMILVLGGTGTVGGRVAGQLRAAGRDIRVATRHTTPSFDWADDSTWAGVLSGVPEMFLLLPDRTALPEAFLPAARDAGVRRVVLHSDRGLDVMGNTEMQNAEAAVRGSGLAWTIVRPDWFHQDFETFFGPAVAGGRLCVPVGDVRQGFVDAGDIAAVEVAAFGDDTLIGQVVEVTGPRSLSFGEAVGVISRATGRVIDFDGSVDAYRAAMRADSMPDEVIEALVSGYTTLRGLGDTVPTGEVERILGRPGRDFADYAADAAARGVWDGTSGPVRS
ncbi:serine hydrolase [Actinoplanes couchii]|uniref:Beta-lactamase-related domain-containing protein n=1 Tax=Actinoplanes couchii TaxID=403638 RepID=A0ABQ3XPN9_9ACTN|nr:serine hydrolase [Actinoplanes couchii]MDR6319141.1 CubicO group peptidase (beta-lactamase class C family)/uncharacterized protein YbjT (DUF2867 family) [Actinoplanes couchii]GID60482.1 hypothetical protein Aco03nite_088860 [Actinoplanes couchii]